MKRDYILTSSKLVILTVNHLIELEVCILPKMCLKGLLRISQICHQISSESKVQRTEGLSINNLW